MTRENQRQSPVQADSALRELAGFAPAFVQAVLDGVCSSIKLSDYKRGPAVPFLAGKPR